VAEAGVAVPVEVFTRAESVNFLQGRNTAVGPEEADAAAERLGDLPLALAQVAGMQTVTGMPWSRYLAIFDGHVRDLLDHGRQPAHYSTTLTALVDLAVKQIQTRSPITAQLLELFAHLGPEPVPLSLLHGGRDGKVTPTLARCLADQQRLRRTVYELARYGLVSVRPDAERIVVHRLVRECLRGSLDVRASARGRENAWAILAACDPGGPDDSRTWGMHALIAPHVGPADLVAAADDAARLLLVRQLRYLYLTGDYEAARALGEAVRRAWPDQSAGTVDEFATRVVRHLANTLRVLGEYQESSRLTEQALAQLLASPDYGPDHELTLDVAMSAGADLRIRGRYEVALATDRDTLRRSARVHGRRDARTLKYENNLATSARMLGGFEVARRRDVHVMTWRSRFRGVNDNLIHLSRLNLAWDAFGLGRYAEMLARVEEAEREFDPALRPEHSLLLLAGRTRAVALRSLGRPEAMEVARDCHERHLVHLGADDERSLAAGLSSVNALRVAQRHHQAANLALEVQENYRRRFGWSHPVTIAASVALATVLRGLGRARDARAIDERARRDLRHELGLHQAHPFALSAANGLAADLVAEGNVRVACEVAEQTRQVAEGWLTRDHPVLLACLANTALAYRTSGDEARAEPLLATATAGLERALGSAHPHVLASRTGSWIEIDIEPPPA
jgi:tetratricopeptide (TPR) repeat protein